MSYKKGRDVLKPDLYYSAVWNVDFELLAEKGIKNVLIDVDSTIADAYSDEIFPRAERIIIETRKKGIIKNFCLVSNTITGKKKNKRLASMGHKLKTPFVGAQFYRAKPHKGPFLKGLKLLGGVAKNTAMIGDQIFTDIKGANKLGLLSVLVKPQGKIHWTTIISFRRLREKRLLKKFGLKVMD
ncbi:MAG: YqeG family HAD IIIA-type phosphatase [Vulcanimicrobiota bacterium]